ncbi:hypothetical protein GCM10007913_02830 [Devosia yakushimensis]|uniref:Uncharacterized protein n=1 Tax=Devosia yakushimensis TaxID=470028 RepID=A0ABQ5UCT6_9HYPH|nr:hypothetical protein [Devosia yakushimensis]GLQ08351.1 hypothetical protein GCM10007913_02830 [Devosia yakushimensis]
MRAGPALLLLLACATPAVAQSKSKVPQSVQVLEVCEKFATGDVLARENAEEHGWTIYDEDGESPYVRFYTGEKDIPGIGYAELTVLIEDYPGKMFGYCRVDASEPSGDAVAEIEPIDALERYDGKTTKNDDGMFGSFTGAGDPDTLLLAHHSETSFVIQLTVIRPQAETE